jgi:hypothetical protein
VRRLGGSIAVVSPAGGGAEFVVRLPAAAPAGVARAPGTPAGVPPQGFEPQAMP